MKRFFLALITSLTTTFISVTCLANSIEKIDPTTTWLNIIDSGNYEESWHKTAPFFQSKISKEKWATALNQVRTPLGKVISRKHIQTSTHTSLPGAPDGKYKVVKHTTSYKHKSFATETVTLSREQNEWRVVGYFIK